MTPPPKNFPIASRPQWLREKFEIFRIWYATKQGCGVESESESESTGVGSFDRSRSRLQQLFIISFLVKMETKMETEHFVLQTADSYDGLPCTVLLSRWGSVCFRVN